MNTHKNGILVRFPLAFKKGKKSSYSVSFCDFISNKILEGASLGYKCFVFELSDEDFNVLDFSVNEEQKNILISRINEGIRVSIYIKTKKYLTADAKDEVDESVKEIKSCLDFINDLKIFKPQEFPLIIHVGGAKGNRKSTMEDFCDKLEEYLDTEQIHHLAVVNDEKPSLFSVKDLLPGVFYKMKIPIVFRSTSYPTNQGNLTLNESLFLAASTWKRTVNPIFIYLPGQTSLGEEQTRPFGLELDVVFDNRLPEP
jgi:hypothetical protein